MKMNKSKISEYFIQFLIVVIGVFLGMLVTDWNADRKMSKNRTVLLNSLKTEIEDNKKSLEGNWSNRRAFFKSLDSLGNDITRDQKRERFFDKPWSERLPNWKGFGSGKLNNSMFESAKYGNILAGMNIDLLQQLSKTYNIQHNTVSLRNTMMGKFFDIDTNTEYGDVLLLMYRVRQELGGSEYILNQEYEHCIKMIDENLSR